MAITPTILTTALTEHAKANELKNISLFHLHTEGPCPYAAEDCEGILKAKSFFVGSNVRQATREGRADYIPVFLSEMPLLFRNGIIPLDCAIVQVSPPDRHGYCSLGTSVDCTRAAIQTATTCVAQINTEVPRTYGDGIIHISNFDHIWYHDAPLYTSEPAPPSEAEVTIGQRIAENLVQDGATLQMGIGSIPNAVLAQLGHHKNLGVHTEMFSDGVLDLVESGVVDGKMKTKRTGKLVATFLTGSKRLYDFVHDNPMVDMCDAGFTNNPHRIAEQYRMTAINSCIEIDLTGQVVSDSIGTGIYSGVGGQMDFLRGAALAHEGKPILAMPSRTHKGVGRIVDMIKPGAGVVTTRAHVHYVVTEHGIVNLYGKPLQERARLLISIAHPDDREALFNAARERHLL